MLEWMSGWVGAITHINPDKAATRPLYGPSLIAACITTRPHQQHGHNNALACGTRRHVASGSFSNLRSSPSAMALVGSHGPAAAVASKLSARAYRWDE